MSSTTPSIDYSDLDTRIALCRRAIESMRNGHFAISLPVEPLDPVGLLGMELQELANHLDKQFDQIRKLQQISEAVSGGLLLEDTLNRIFETFHSVIPYNRIGCSLISEDQSVVTAYWARIDQGDMALPRGFSASLSKSSLSSIMLTGKPRILNDLREHSRSHPRSAATRLMLKEGMRSSLTCPLIAQGKPVGFLFFSSREPGTYQAIHQGIFLRLAAMVSILIEKSMLYERIVEINERLNEAHREMQELAMRDALTGVYNRRGILDLLDSAFAEGQRSGSRAAVMMVDIDYFKSINDTHGHAAGDMALRSVAQQLMECLRPYDRIGRFGGEEFIVMASGVDAKTVLEVGERLRRAIAQNPIKIGDREIGLTVSIGIAFADKMSDVIDVQQFIMAADEALYRAKNSGRNRVHLSPLAAQN